MSVEPHDIVMKWYESSRIDYRDLYMRLYVSYNAWFRQVTGAASDRDAIKLLKSRFVIWYDYQCGLTLQELRPLVVDIIKLLESQHSLHLRITDADDYKNLIEFWYRVRCYLFHGSSVYLPDEIIILAYESLSIFMSEIVARMKASFTDDDLARLNEVTSLISNGHEPADDLLMQQQALQLKYVRSPDMWSVDMLPV